MVWAEWEEEAGAQDGDSLIFLKIIFLNQICDSPIKIISTMTASSDKVQFILETSL